MTRSANDHCRDLLAAIVPGRRDLLDFALRHLAPEHFPDAVLRNIFTMLTRYVEVTGAVMPRAAMSDMVRGAGYDAGKIALYQEVYDLIHDSPVDEAGFRWALEQIRELAAERATTQAIATAAEILTRGLRDERGRELRGHVEARSYVLTQLAEVDKALAMQDSPEGDVRTEGEAILADYAQRKKLRLVGRGQGITFGIPSLDAAVGGIGGGELVFIAGYSGDGKTTLACQLAWSAAVVQGRNVYFATTETLRDQVRRKLVARHSLCPQFEIPHGLNSRDLRGGSLPEEQEGKLQEVVADLTRNTAYGRLHIAQVPRGASITTLEARLRAIQHQWPVDLLIVDYLALLRSDRRRDSIREELSDIIKEAKQIATTYDDGRGVPLISPWQVNRSSARDAAASNEYTSAALAESAEATNSADVIVSLRVTGEAAARRTTLRAQVLKNRDGGTATGLELEVDYATCCIAEKAGTDLDRVWYDDRDEDDPLLRG